VSVVKFAGRFRNNSAIGPSPLPSTPWQTAQEFRYSCSPLLICCAAAALSVNAKKPIVVRNLI
jgi:hypothetical protein